MNFVEAPSAELDIFVVGHPGSYELNQCTDNSVGHTHMKVRMSFGNVMLVSIVTDAVPPPSSVTELVAIPERSPRLSFTRAVPQPVARFACQASDEYFTHSGVARKRV